ncbi:kinase-like domain-containing protein [Xylariaceae sp. FL0594]|nr:kinase-like domain-containing protein [Xylariaceae sp. FL0594]
MDSPCTACSWTAARQDGCRYNSHVKIFREVSDRACWSLGSRLILKERSAAPPNYEAANIGFLRQNTSIPVPEIVEEWTEGEENGSSGRHFIITKRVEGVPLSEAWGKMSQEDREKVARQVGAYLAQLRRLQSPRMECLGGKPVYSTFLFPGSEYEDPHGPMASDDKLWAEMTKNWHGKEAHLKYLRDKMPRAEPYTFTHRDLTNENIMVKDGNLTGIIDWEASGFFPMWWEYACAGIGLGDDDAEWKALLRKHMPDFKEARQFYRAFVLLGRDHEGTGVAKEIVEEMKG